MFDREQTNLPLSNSIEAFSVYQRRKFHSAPARPPPPAHPRPRAAGRGAESGCVSFGNMAEEAELHKLREERKAAAALPSSFDSELYSEPSRDGYVDSIEVDGEEPEDGDDTAALVARRLAGFTAPKSVTGEIPRGEPEDAGNVRAPLALTFAAGCAVALLGLCKCVFILPTLGGFSGNGGL